MRARVRGRPLLCGLACGLAFSALMALSFPGVTPGGVWPLALLAVGPLVALAEIGGTLRRGLVRAAVGAGVGSGAWWALAMVWTFRNTEAGFVPLVVYLSLYAGLFVWAAGRVRRRWRGLPSVVLLPMAWVGLEVVRGEWGFDGYPWYLVGHPMIEGWGLFVWPAAIAGAYAVSVLATLPVAAACDWALGRRKWAVGAVAVVVAWPLVGLTGVFSAREVGSVRVGLVQTDVPQDVRGAWDPTARWADFLRMVDLTIRAAGGVAGGVGGGAGEREPDLIVWPETMFPGTALDDASVEAEKRASLAWTVTEADGTRRQIPAWAARDGLLELQARLGVPMIVGSSSFERLRVVEDERGLRYDWDARRNSAFLIERGRVRDGWYSKISLTPFGEVMPYISKWPWLEAQLLNFGARGMRFDLEPGDRPVTIEVAGRGGDFRVATPICFEATMAGTVRELVYPEQGVTGTHLIVVLTNDGWFGDWDAGRWQHLQAARWRCVELGRGMARAANTGVSAIVDARGRVVSFGVEGGAARVDGVLVGEAPMYAGGTVFGRFVGLWPAYGLGVLGLAACIVPFGKRRKGL